MKAADPASVWIRAERRAQKKEAVPASFFCDPLLLPERRQRALLLSLRSHRENSHVNPTVMIR